jgi:hypothetical protein
MKMSPEQEMVLAIMDDGWAWILFAAVLLLAVSVTLLMIFFVAIWLQILIRFAIRQIRRRFAERRI